jgi:hypothetical protein
LLVASLAQPAPVARGDEVIRPEVLPRGVADPAGKVGYLAKTLGGIVALDLRTGNELWSVTPEEGIRPLIATNRLLITQALPEGTRGPDESLCIAVLVVNETGSTLRAKSPPVPLPPWVAASGLTRKPSTEWGEQWFDIEARILGNSLLVRWRAESRYKGGANLSPDARQKARRFASSAFSIELGGVLGASEGPVRLELRRPPEAPLARAFDDLPEAFSTVSSVEYMRGGRPSSRPFVVGDRIVALARRGADLIMRGWDLLHPSVSHPPIPLMTLASDYPGLEVTLDGHHLLVEETEGFAARPVQGPSPRKLFSLDSGKLLANLPPEPDVVATSVLDHEVYCECLHKKGQGLTATTERTIKAMRVNALNDVQFRWKHTLEERIAVNTPPPPPRPELHARLFLTGISRLTLG